jgi:sugar phosphate isomerase/epimerase
MPYTRGFSTLGFPEGSIDAVLALAEAHSLDAVEIRALGGTVDVPSQLAAAWGTPAALAGRLGASRVRVVSLDTSLHLIGGTGEERSKFLEFLPWAEAAGIPWLRVFDGGGKAGDAGIDEAAATVRWWRDLRRDRGLKVDIMVETHDSLLSAAPITRFLERAPGTAILWDSFNTWLRSGEAPLATWESIGNSVVHVHVKDCIRVPSGAHPFTYVLPGTGEFPMAPLREKLRAGFTGTVSLEWERLWIPGLAPLEDALASAARLGWW